MCGLFNLRKGVRSSILSHERIWTFFFCERRQYITKRFISIVIKMFLFPSLEYFVLHLSIIIIDNSYARDALSVLPSKLFLRFIVLLFTVSLVPQIWRTKLVYFGWLRLKFLAEELGVSRIKSPDKSKFIGADWHFLNLSSRRHLSARTAWWGMAPWWLVGSRE